MTPEAASPTDLGHPHVYLKRTDSTNERARALAIAGAPHGTLVSAAEQTAGRGRQGRLWVAPPGSSLLCSLVVRNPSPLLPLIAGVAVSDVVGEGARLKWPNDVVVGPQLAKLAGILVEGRPQDAWAVLGIGLNVAVRVEQLPSTLRSRAATMGLAPDAIEETLQRLLVALGERLVEPPQSVLEAWRGRDALHDRQVSWEGGQGRARGIDERGRLLVALGDGSLTALDAGEVHLAL